MCGIFFLLDTKIDGRICQAFEKGSKRGPESHIIKIYDDKIIMGFHRLAINGLDNESNQPLEIDNIVLICNGEIYNYKYLYKLLPNVTPQTNSDCEIIIHLYKAFGIKETINLLDGVYAFVLYNRNWDSLDKKNIYIARDTFGVRPLFQSTNPIAFASEMKMLVDLNPETIKPFPPGTLISLQTSNPIPIFKNIIYNTIPYTIDYSITTINEACIKIKTSFEEAVRKRVITTERPIACLLSGGLDSSLVTALVSSQYEDLETYSIGLPGSEDLKYAQKVADFLGTKHTQIVLSEETFLEAIPETIHAIESYDTTTVRASVGNYLVAKYISQHSNAKVIFNGDGSDEVCGGYLYFLAAPNPLEFDIECRRLLKDIHMFDVLRSDRSISSNGLEARTPFLDKSFVQTYLSIPPHLRDPTASKWRKQGKSISPSKCEKYLLRRAFQGILPDEILYRKKEAFSDGVSSIKKSWYEIIAQHMSTIQIPHYHYAFNTPTTDEQRYYRNIFDKYYNKHCEVISYFWMPKFIDAKDSSARTLNLYTT